MQVASENHSADQDSRPCDVSILVTAHRESLLIHRCLRSAAAAIAHAQQNNIVGEIVVILHQADEETLLFARQFEANYSAAPLQILETDLPDRASVLELGHAAAQGKYIAQLDAANLLNEDWLSKALAFSQVLPPRAILHAEYQVNFGAELQLIKHRPSRGTESNGFAPHHLVSHNPWTSLLFYSRWEFATRRETRCPNESKPVTPFPGGDEDCHWLAEQLAHGAEIQIVPGTCNFLRQQPTFTAHSQVSCWLGLLPPTKALDPVELSQQTLESTPLTRAKPSRLQKLKQKFSALIEKHCPEALGLSRRIQTGIQKLFLKRRKTLAANAPAWQAKLWHDCQTIHDIEPKIFPTGGLFSEPVDNHRHPPVLAHKYQAACRFITRQPTHVLVIPWLKKGGADLEVLHYVRAIQHASPNNAVLVITTNDSDSPWSKRLSPEVMQLPFGEIFADVSQEDQKRMLGTLLIQLQAPIIHLVNSRLGYALVRDYGDAIRNGSQIFASCFCEDITPEGRTVGFAFDEQPEVYRHLSGIFSDNQTILDKLTHTFGYPAEKLFRHYMPIDPCEAITIADREKLQVLWAGRLDRQKRPDLLRKITEKLAGHPIHFTIYGSAVLERKANYKNWSGLSNVTYQGPYDGFESLPLSQFDVFLHTAQWEGLPNVLLEAYSHGLPVVASGVGGVPELVRTGENGYCITPYDDVDAYCQALLELQASRAKLHQYANAGRALVQSRHSWDAFQKTLGEVPGYLTPASHLADACPQDIKAA